VGDRASPVYQDSDLATKVSTDAGELTREFVGQQAIGREVAPEQALQLANLTGLEPVGIAEDLDLLAPRCRCARPPSK
jgi:hypothetical protein